MLQCAKGDQGAFDALFERYRDPICDYLACCTGDAALAEDLCQETFVRMYLNKHRYRAGAPFKPWLFAIATNVGRDEKRRQRARSEAALPRDGTGPAEAYRADASSPRNAELERVEVKEAVQSALLALPMPLRQAFLLSHREGMSTREVARAVGCSEACARQRISRALRQLRQVLKEYLGERG
jgi:RNA polymerase sigma-70 factor (ECF subfamily)